VIEFFVLAGGKKEEGSKEEGRTGKDTSFNHEALARGRSLPGAPTDGRASAPLVLLTRVIGMGHEEKGEEYLASGKKKNDASGQQFATHSERLRIGNWEKEKKCEYSEKR